jgi:VanZ family protein
VPEPWRNPRPAPQLREIQSRLSGQLGEGTRLGWLRPWWPAILWACFIFIMSTDSFSAQHTARFFEPLLRWLIPSLTPTQFTLIHRIIRKMAHLSEYFMFSLLLYRGVRGSGQGWHWTWGLAAFSIAAGYGALDEVHQIFVASRQASPYDAMIDATGALFAVLAVRLWFRLRPPAMTGRPSEQPDPEAL